MSSALEDAGDWTFTKLLECILSSSHLDELPGMETEVVCKLSKEINSPERVEVPLGFVIEPCYFKPLLFSQVEIAPRVLCVWSSITTRAYSS